jgi:hypothetical protein
MTYRNTRRQKTFFKRKRAAERKEDPIVLPVVNYIVWLSDNFAV